VKPSIVIDVTDVQADWTRAAECYASQLHSIPGYHERIMRFKREAGSMIGVEFGEAFLCDLPLNATQTDLLSL
jgi:hypothetical protein